MKAPYPFFGGKARVASLVWRALGDVANYVEPFFGSGAVLLARPHAPRIETVNDVDHFISNTWRAMVADPEAVARWCDWPVSECDVSARHQWLVDSDEFRERMQFDPVYYDAQRAGWWLYGISSWIGQGWCARAPWLATAVPRQLPHLNNAGRGVHRLSQDPAALVDYFRALSQRLRRVRVACGDWSRVVTESVTVQNGLTGLFLDPPYDDGSIDYAAGGRGVAREVGAWCRENGNDKRLRIVLAGYEGDHDLPGWTVHAWKAHGGYALQNKGETPNENAHRERLWLSPSCLSVTTSNLLDLLNLENHDG